MAIIKQAQIEMDAPGARVPALEDLDARLQTLIADAEQSARAIISTAREEGRALQDEARCSGHAEGFEAGRAEGRAAALAGSSERIDAVLASWTSALGKWEQDRASQLRKAEEELVGTALQLAETIVRRSISIDPTSVQGPLQSALELVRRPTDVVVRVHPEDADFVSEVLGDAVSCVAACRSARLQPDDTVEVGGCRLELEGGGVDATIKTQLDRIASILLPERGGVHG